MSGSALYIITAKDTLIRKIPRVPSHIKISIENGKEVKRITSANFKTKKGEDGLSVQIEKLVESTDTVVNQTTHTAAFFLAKVPMDLGKECKHDPTATEYAHALIVGDTRSIAKKIANACHKILDEDILIGE